MKQYNNNEGLISSFIDTDEIRIMNDFGFKHSMESENIQYNSFYTDLFSFTQTFDIMKKKRNKIKVAL